MASQEYYVLLVDDDIDLMETMKEILEREGYHVDTSPTAEGALKKLREHYYDVIVIDIMLPDMSGIDLLRSIEVSRIPRIRKIILTGHATLENAVQSLNLGADAYLIKPVAPGKLIRTIADQIKKQNDEILMIQDRIRRFIERDVEERIKRIAEEKYL
ncbi:MAG: response regulator [Candidatus Methanosuratincola sp.]